MRTTSVTNESRTEVLCIGEAMVMVAPANGSPLDGDGLCLLRTGGAESNVAATLSALGHRSAWAGAVGDDPLGTIVLDELHNAGIDLSYAHRAKGQRTAVYFKDPSPEGTQVYYYRDGSAASRLTRKSLSGWAASAPEIVHVSGITPALSESCADLIDEVVHERAFSGSIVSFDVNFRRALWPTEDAANKLLGLSRASDVVFVGRDEAEALWGTATAAEVRQLLPDIPHLVVKDGAVGAHHFTGSFEYFSAAPKVQVLEPVGAGDAFAAGWLSGLLQNFEPMQRLRLGHLIASYVLTSPTDSADYPDAAQRSALIETDPSTW